MSPTISLRCHMWSPSGLASLVRLNQCKQTRKYSSPSLLTQAYNKSKLNQRSTENLCKCPTMLNCQWLKLYAAAANVFYCLQQPLWFQPLPTRSWICFHVQQKKHVLLPREALMFIQGHNFCISSSAVHTYCQTTHWKDSATTSKISSWNEAKTKSQVQFYSKINFTLSTLII